MPHDEHYDNEEWCEEGGRPGAKYMHTTRWQSPIGPRKRNRLVLVILVASVLLVYRYFPARPLPSCPQTRNTNDVLVVLRTGATEALEKLPVHFETTLHCVPDYVVYSDLEEQIAGHRVRDVFANGSISNALMESPELGFYHHLRKLGRQGLLALRAYKQPSKQPSGQDNPAWKLDRFKFLPMISQALHHRPSAKWFVFMEADTYLVFENLVHYLSHFDATKPLYIGRQMYMGDVIFAHGGSGFVLSRPAMHRIVEQRNAYGVRYDAYAKESVAGDVVLGRVLADSNIPLFSAFPHFQGDAVAALDFNVSKADRRPWCYVPITYHHMHEKEIRALWEFEQSWRLKSSAPLRHAGVFKHFIRPQLRSKVGDWDNLSLGNSDSSSDAATVPSFADCKAICEAEPACLQFSYETATGNCATSTRVVLGEAASRQCVEYSSAAGGCVRWQGDGDENDESLWMGKTTPGSVQSGWMVHRMQQYVEEMDSMCGGGEMNMWVV